MHPSPHHRTVAYGLPLNDSQSSTPNQTQPIVSYSEQSWDVIVIGGGAAGLMASASAAQFGKRTLLLEKNRKFGVKILMSGGTRCNITHNTDVRGIVEAFGRNGKFLHSALSVLSPADCVELFNSLGVETKVESTGKVFPVSNKAIDVRDALVRYARDNGAELVNETPVVGLQKLESGEFEVETDGGSIQCRSVIVTTGGLSFPGCGTTGDGYPWAESFGHSIVDTVPALTPLLSRCEWANELKGVTIDPTRVEVWEPETETAKKKKRQSKPAAKSDPADMNSLLDEVGVQKAAGRNSCPNCRSKVDVEATICIHCGMNLASGKRVKQKLYGSAGGDNVEKAPSKWDDPKVKYGTLLAVCLVFVGAIYYVVTTFG